VSQSFIYNLNVTFIIFCAAETHESQMKPHSSSELIKSATLKNEAALAMLAKEIGNPGEDHALLTWFPTVKTNVPEMDVIFIVQELHYRATENHQVDSILRARLEFDGGFNCTTIPAGLEFS
jgi:hypothetical protein